MTYLSKIKIGLFSFKKKSFSHEIWLVFYQKINWMWLDNNEY